MRNLIIGLSILFFVLSGIITFKALEIPVKNSRYQNNPKESISKDLSFKLENISIQFAKEQAANRTLVEELLSTVTRLENKLSNMKEETQANVKAEGPKKTTRVLAVLAGGMLSSGQVVINENQVKAVKKIVLDLLAFPDKRLIIEGHTDNRPIKSFPGEKHIDNMGLSLLRAEAIANMLVKSGISPERISVIGYADTRPIATNKTFEGRAKNRRVEVKLIP